MRLVALIPPAPFSLTGRRGSSQRCRILMPSGSPLPLRERGGGVRARGHLWVMDSMIWAGLLRRAVVGAGGGEVGCQILVGIDEGVGGVPGRRASGLRGEAVEAVEVGGFVKPLSPTLHGLP